MDSQARCPSSRSLVRSVALVTLCLLTLLIRRGELRQAGHDGLEVGVVGDALEVKARRVRGFQRADLVVAELDVERGDGVVDLADGARSDERAVTTGLPRSQASATWARFTPRASATAPTASVIAWSDCPVRGCGACRRSGRRGRALSPWRRPRRGRGAVAWPLQLLAPGPSVNAPAAPGLGRPGRVCPGPDPERPTASGAGREFAERAGRPVPPVGLNDRKPEPGQRNPRRTGSHGQ
jgi:hypothetical protein